MRSLIVSQPRHDHLEELLARIYAAQQRPNWRRWFLHGASPVINVSLLRVLRAVQRFRQRGDEASIRDVADCMTVEHSTASRTVAAAVSAGLLTKTFAADDQRRCVLALTEVGGEALAMVTDRRRGLVADTIADWPETEVETLVALLDQLAGRFERAAGG